MMKKLVLKVSALCFAVITLVSCDKEEVVTVDQIPTTANAFLNEHFSGIQVLSAVKEKDALSGTDYEVLLNNGIEVKFDKNGNWDEVEARDDRAGIPTSFILPSVVAYVTAHYPTALINSIDKEKNGFNIELTNGLDLVFDLEGNFLRIDP